MVFCFEKELKNIYILVENYKIFVFLSFLSRITIPFTDQHKNIITKSIKITTNPKSILNLNCKSISGDL